MTARQTAHAALDALIDRIGEARAIPIGERLHAMLTLLKREDKERAALERTEQKIERTMAEVSVQWEELRYAIEAVSGMMPCDAEGAS